MLPSAPTDYPLPPGDFDVRHQYTVLDGLRGVAAVSVMLFHRRDWFGGDPFMGHAYLAVDFFFMLSGFVLAHAYGERLLRPGSFAPFVRDRVFRLHPMLLAGAVLALLVTLADARAGRMVALHWAPLTFVASLLPAPAPWAGAASAFPWNIALWSLTWELVANFLYAALATRLTNRVLAVTVVVSIVIMIACSMAFRGFQVGFANDAVLLALGLPRVCASFFIGVLVQRWRPEDHLPVNRLGGACAVALVVSFAALPLHSPLSAVYDPAVAFLLYPAILVLAARSVPVAPRFCLIAGALSYPLYVLHEPALRLVGAVLTALHLAHGPPAPGEAVARFALTGALAFAALKLYDEPARAWLRRTVRARRP